MNRCFEIMNTRGEQLEQHDILKATLMSMLTSRKSKELFADIWEACSDMTGYVQMNFNTELRPVLFGGGWSDLPQPQFKRKSPARKVMRKSNEFCIQNIIKPTFVVKKTAGVTDKDERVRFESIISFPFFLLHSLKIMVDDKNIEHNTPGETLVFELLDDKKLTDAFARVIAHGEIGGKRISDNKETFSIGFIKCLLKCRYLFDKYIIKREFVNENSDGEWSLKQLEVSGQASNKKPYYVNTHFGTYGEWKQTHQGRHEINLMLQSCLRVSYTSPKVMHWITTLLKWLYGNDNLGRLNEYERQIENIAQSAVYADYIGKVEDELYNWGTDTPHIVFNYLDYLLWKNDRSKFKNFVFEFRNSVEHWYPRHPSEGTFEQWTHEEGVDDFGNLCLIQRSINSKFSNLSPEAKKITFNEMIAKGSLKLRLIAEKTAARSGQNASQNWMDETCAEHESEMLEILMEAINLTGW